MLHQVSLSHDFNKTGLCFLKVELLWRKQQGESEEERDVSLKVIIA